MRISDWSSDVCSSDLQLRRAALERPDPQLRPLQIDEDRRGSAGVLFERADRGDRLRMPGMVAMAHIDAKGVGAGAVERRDHGGIGAGGTKGCQNAHLAPAGGETLDHNCSDCLFLRYG